MSTILVTGGSGFIGSHSILQLLAAGHRVRTTVRSLKREGDVRAMLKEGGADPGDRLSFIAADLENDAGWSEAVAGDFMSIRDIAKALKARMGAAAKRVPTLQLPDWLVRIAAMRDPAVRQILPELGKRKNATNQKARRMLGWAPRSNEEAVIATAESLARLGLLKGGSHSER